MGVNDRPGLGGHQDTTIDIPAVTKKLATVLENSPPEVQAAYQAWFSGKATTLPACVMQGNRLIFAESKVDTYA